ncbi:hypothetical protein COMNV_01593 [Commensalibacter sp. Nvir]|uniref:hypothetical protein n=1 Tax=Commensalibacter sp. Nvir TaxID=3069817 RepID=UPI002D3A747E|nr:hypothetical protein COMNV_01593 [Commensalibacter sp. Nvir]
MRFQFSLVTVTFGFVLVACQHPAVIAPDREINNPFKYDKRSAVCTVTPIVKNQDGSLKTEMKVRSDEGQCEFTVETPNPKGAYQSFGVTTLPEHGKTFIYNYDNRTYIRYTPTTAYAGTDQFVAVLISKDDTVKTPLSVSVTVDNTGVPLPKPVVETKPDTSTSKAKTNRNHRKRAVSRTKKKNMN